MLIRVCASCLLLGLLVLGCTSNPAPTTNLSTAPPAGSAYLLDAEPAGAVGVIAARETAADGDPIVIVGKIGGSVDPWVEDLAAFMLVDTSLRSCSDIPGDTCPTPWDYCCESDVAAGRTLVKVVDESGIVIEEDAAGFLGLEPLDTLVVQGTARRDEAGNLTILASRVFVREGGGHASAAGDHEHDHEDGHVHGDTESDEA